MPLQRSDTRTVHRPAGMVPPAADLTGLTELRLHGVGGTTPEDLLADDAPQHVSGDRIAGFYRTADLPDRHVEAYSWGGLTSRSGIRVLWLLLFPFALANVAGWMCTSRTHTCPWRFRLHRGAVRLAALWLTLNLLLIIALTTMELLSYQCGGRRDCAGNSWLLRWLTDPALTGHPGRRLLLGALAPLAVIILLAALSLRSIHRYEETSPPWQMARSSDPDQRSGRTPRPAHSAAQPGFGLADRSFWDGRRSAYDLGCLHVAAGLAFVALTLTHTAGSASRLAASPQLRLITIVLGGATLLGAMVLLVLDTCPVPARRTALTAGTASVLCAGWFALAQPGFTQPFGYLPGMRDIANLTLAGILVTLLAVLLTAMAGGWRRGTFVIFGPFVALCLAVFSLNLVLISALSRIAALVANASVRVDLPAGSTDEPEISLYPIIADLVPYLTLLPLAALLAFAGYELVTYWRAGTRRETLDGIRDWYRENVPRPDGEEAWRYNALDRDDRWVTGIARARRVARMPHDLDKLLTVIAGVGCLLVIVIQVPSIGSLPWGTGWMFTVGSYLAACIPVAVIVLLRSGWRNLHSRRRIGVLWDVLTFWPRAYHPLAPPAYSERAVPELQRRLWRIHSSGGRVLLASHSQGTVIAVAALLQAENRPADDVVTLVTFGSPLRTLYGWAFPAYFNDGVLRPLVSGQVHAWRNFHYRTDYIGGSVLAPGTEPAPGTEVDVELPDPRTRWYIYGQPKPATTRHAGYWSDPTMWEQVDRLAEATSGAPRIPRQWSEPAPGQISEVPG